MGIAKTRPCEHQGIRVAQAMCGEQVEAPDRDHHWGCVARRARIAEAGSRVPCSSGCDWDCLWILKSVGSGPKLGVNQWRNLALVQWLDLGWDATALQSALFQE